MRALYASLFACVLVLVPSYAQAQQAPVFSGSAATYDYGQCTNTTGTTCTATTFNTYGANAQCFAMDTTSTNPVKATCSVSGSTVTVNTAPTIIGGSCSTSAATSCTWTSPFAASTSTRCVVGGTSSTAAYGHCVLASTTVTVTLSASATDTWQTTVLVTTPSATTHVFQYIVWQ